MRSSRQQQNLVKSKTRQRTMERLHGVRRCQRRSCGLECVNQFDEDVKCKIARVVTTDSRFVRGDFRVISPRISCGQRSCGRVSAVCGKTVRGNGSSLCFPTPRGSATWSRPHRKDSAESMRLRTRCVVFAVSLVQFKECKMYHVKFGRFNVSLALSSVMEFKRSQASSACQVRAVQDHQSGRFTGAASVSEFMNGQVSSRSSSRSSRCFESHSSRLSIFYSELVGQGAVCEVRFGVRCCEPSAGIVNQARSCSTGILRAQPQA